jgi:hypothetical protein
VAQKSTVPTGIRNLPSLGPSFPSYYFSHAPLCQAASSSCHWAAHTPQSLPIPATVGGGGGKWKFGKAVRRASRRRYTSRLEESPSKRIWPETGGRGGCRSVSQYLYTTRPSLSSSHLVSYKNYRHGERRDPSFPPKDARLLARAGHGKLALVGEYKDETLLETI